MRDIWRPLALAAAFIATMAAGPASAQTVTVTKAPPGASIQLILDSTTVATAKADDKGIATLTLDLQKERGRTESDVRIFVDVCGNDRRVTLVEAGYQPDQAPPVCVRHEIFGVFFLKQVTSLVVNVSAETQGVWIAQGPAPLRWLGDEVAGGSAEETGSALYVPNGFHIFGGGGFARYGNFVDVTCGVNTACSGKSTKMAAQAGFDYWITSNIAIAGFYLRPASPGSAGSGGGYAFDSALSTNVAAVTGKVGVPFGKTRLYAQVGATYTWSTLTTNETIGTNSQTLTQNTRGMSWTLSGGTEYWWRRSMALYIEAGRAGLKGTVVGGGDGNLDDSVIYGVFGLRFRLVGSR